jgi:hypothetical protein
VHLLDVNLLIALAWPNHVHHDLAHRWFGKHRSSGWATCPATEGGFVRVSSNVRLIPEARTPLEVLELLRRIVELPGHRFWKDDVSPARSRIFPWERVVGYRQVSDAHLLALALRHKGRVATLDRGMVELVPRGMDPAEVIALIVE